jgi:hypothetical protein
MVFEIAGVNHFDPLGRQGLYSWLVGRVAKYASSPSFVGVEYHQEVFQAIKQQRPSFRTLINELWPDLGCRDAAVLADALAYEGDTHLAVVPTVPTVWLDPRALPESGAAVERYAELRLGMYRGFANAADGTLPFLMGLSKVARSIATNDIDFSRSAVFADRAAEAARSLGGSWSVLIVGNGHAMVPPSRSMRGILEGAGHLCLVESLC